MKKPLLIFIILSLCHVSSSAQENGWNGGMGLHTDISRANNKMSSFASTALTAFGGYNFDDVALYLPVEVAISNFDYSSGASDRHINFTLGLGVGFYLLNDTRWGSLEITLTVGKVINYSYFDYIYFDAGVRWNLSSRNPKMFVGLGARSYNQPKYDDFQIKPYITVGIRFN